MELFSLALLALTLGGCCLGLEDESLSYEIKTTWDGRAIDHDPARVTLFVTKDGDVNLTMSAPFFNSPKPEKAIIENCPERSTRELWNYEVNAAPMLVFYLVEAMSNYTYASARVWWLTL